MEREGKHGSQTEDSTAFHVEGPWARSGLGGDALQGVAVHSALPGERMRGACGIKNAEWSRGPVGNLK